MCCAGAVAADAALKLIVSGFAKLSRALSIAVMLSPRAADDPVLLSICWHPGPSAWVRTSPLTTLLACARYLQVDVLAASNALSTTLPPGDEGLEVAADLQPGTLSLGAPDCCMLLVLAARHQEPLCAFSRAGAMTGTLAACCRLVALQRRAGA